VKHRDTFKDGQFTGRIEPGDGAYEVMLGYGGRSGYDPLTAAKYRRGCHPEDGEYVTAIHEDDECRFYGFHGITAPMR
jgi:hypothetical protein